LNNDKEPATDLRKIPLFAALGEPALERLRIRLRTRRFAEGDVILRAGDLANEMHVIVEGAARVELDAGSGRARRRALLGAGQSFGEMSILTAAPVSATIIAHRDTTTYALAAEDLGRLLEEQPGLYRQFVSLLAERLRHRTRIARIRPAVVALELCGDMSLMLLVDALSRGIKHYAPESVFHQAAGENLAPALHRIDRWREEGPEEQYLILALPAGGLSAVRGSLEAGDAALRVIVAGAPGQNVAGFDAGLADTHTVVLGDQAVRGPGPWTYSLSYEELQTCSKDGSVWVRKRYPTLDRIVRFLTFREIGVAMSVGAAAAFAHLGFLEVLEQADIPIDYLCGSSMGGAVALGYGAFGKVATATDVICRLGAEFAKARGIQMLPRAGLLSRQRIEHIVSELFGERTFSELCRPVAVVAADLVAGERVVLDTGRISVAARATSAIPGLFPPVPMGSRILVDGGLVTRVPADLLARRRCGLRLAGVARSKVATTALEREAEAGRLQKRLDQLFGLRAALGAAWKLLGWWDSAAQAQKADLVVEIDTPSRDGFNFAAGASMVECGRVATRQHIETIRQAVNRVLTPGMP